MNFFIDPYDVTDEWVKLGRAFRRSLFLMVLGVAVALLLQFLFIKESFVPALWALTAMSAVVMSVVFVHLHDPRLFNAPMVLRRRKRVIRGHRVIGSTVQRVDWTDEPQPLQASKFVANLSGKRCSVGVYANHVSLLSGKRAVLAPIDLPNELFVSDEARTDFIRLAERCGASMGYFTEADHPLPARDHAIFIRPVDVTANVRTGVKTGFFVLGAICLTAFLFWKVEANRDGAEGLVFIVPLIVYLTAVRKYIVAAWPGSAVQGFDLRDGRVGKYLWRRRGGMRLIKEKSVALDEIETADVIPQNITLVSRDGRRKRSLSVDSDHFANDEAWNSFLDMLESHMVRIEYADENFKPLSERPARQSLMDPDTVPNKTELR